jgi:hypothetical protein
MTLSSPNSNRSRHLGNKLDTLGDVTLEAVVTSLEKLLLVVVRAADNVDRLLGTAGLYYMLARVFMNDSGTLTPSSIGTEKKSVPVTLAMASPPLTPGRYTKLGSTMPFSPLEALITFSAKLLAVS